MQIDRATSRQTSLISGTPINEIDLKYRQGGSSKFELGMATFYAITHPGTNVLIMGHEKALPTEFLGTIRVFIASMPDWCRPKIKKDSTSEIEFAAPVGSTIRIGSGRMIEEGAGIKIGRTVQYLLVTEASDPAWKTDAMVELFQTVPLTGNKIVESTAKGARGWFYREYFLAKEGHSEFVARFWPWWWQPEYVVDAPDDMLLTDEEQRLVDEHRLTARQIAFRRTKIAQLGKRKFMEQYPEDDLSCFLLSGSNFFDRERVAEQMARAKSYCERHTPWRGRIGPVAGAGDGDRAA